MNVIPLCTSKPARIAGAGVAAYLQAIRIGLGPIAASALRRKAREDVARGKSAAKAVADARSTALAMHKAERA